MDTFVDDDVDPDPDTPVTLASVGRGFLRGRPRPLLGREGSTGGLITLFSFGGRPRFRGATSGAFSEAELESSSPSLFVSTGVFLGRPRPRFSGAAAAAGVVVVAVELLETMAFALWTAVETALTAVGMAEAAVDLWV